MAALHLVLLVVALSPCVSALARFNTTDLRQSPAYRATPSRLVFPDGAGTFLLDGRGHCVHPPNVTIHYISDAYLLVDSSDAHTLTLVGVSSAGEMARAVIARNGFAVQMANISCGAAIYHNPGFALSFASSSHMHSFMYSAFDITNGIFDSAIDMRIEYAAVSILHETPTGVTSATASLAEFAAAEKSNSTATAQLSPAIAKQQPAAAPATAVQSCIDILFDGNNYGGNVAGVAYVSGACTAEFGAGVVATKNPAVAAVALAHEIGHLFSAVHDQRGTPCYNENAIMRESITNVNHHFSACSVSDMEDWVDSAACLGGASVNWTAPAPPRVSGNDAWIIATAVVGSLACVTLLFVAVEAVVVVEDKKKLTTRTISLF
jgi:hypothetical protein